MDGEIVIIVVLIPVLFFCVIMLITYPAREKKRAEEKAKRDAQYAAEQQRKKMEREWMENCLKKSEDALAEKYSDTPKRISTSWYTYYDTSKYIYVFPNARILLVLGKEFKFEDILRFELIDNATTNTVTSGGEIKYETNPWSAAGKADAARMLTGSRAAGYAAAQSATQVKVSPTVTKQTTSHKYTVVLYVRDLDNPVVNVSFGDSGTCAREFMGTLEVIKAS